MFCATDNKAYNYSHYKTTVVKLTVNIIGYFFQMASYEIRVHW